MSGGSMDYMYLAGALGQLRKLVEEDCAGPENLRRCVEIAMQAGQDHAAILEASRFANEVDKVLELAESIQAFADRYQGVLQACEWKESGDWGLNQVADALKKVPS
jgi:sugar phosphate isomerase/epimerase